MRDAMPVVAVLMLATVSLGGAAHARGRPGFEDRFDFGATPGPLPRTVLPRAYRIDITPDLAKRVFAGREAIDVDVRVPTAVIVLNQAGLTLRSATLEDGAIADITEDQPRQTATLRFARPVDAGRHTLTIVYNGRIRGSPHGIYFNDDRSADGEPRRVLATQFEPTDARRMFPGWDAPAFKATFQLSATLPADFVAVSNMPIAGMTPSGRNAKHVVFANSPRMSSYLVALVAGEMSAVTGRPAAIDTRAWVPSGREREGQFGLDVAQQVLPFYSGYFDVPYPLPKLDLITVPGKYEARGAMENPGAITFTGGSLDFDPETSSAARREQVFLGVAHEVAHQWTGDLVTMGWWDDLWLNEGIATWMEHKAADYFNPAWQTWPRQHGDRERVMAQDALPSTHPVRQAIADDFEAYQAFDDFSYGKASQVIRMVEDWIGPDLFRDGMRGYIKAHAFSNTTGADLWSALGDASHRDVARIAAGFIEQPGLPLIHVARHCTEGQARITLTQSRFTIREAHPAAETWNIPVTFGRPGEPAERAVLTNSPLTVPIASCDTPIKLNLDESGYYRTQYDDASLKELAGVLPNLEAADRANLLGDQFALFVAGRAPLAQYLDLVGRLTGEQNIAVWEDTLAHLRKLDSILQGSLEQKDFDAYAIALIEPAFARLGWDAGPSEPLVDALLRPKLIAALGRFGDTAVVAEAVRRFSAFVATPGALPAAMRSAVLGIVGHTADQASYDTLRTLATRAAGTESMVRYLNAMAGVTDPTLIKQNLAFAASGAIQSARILPFLIAASRDSGKPDLLYSLVIPIARNLDDRAQQDGYEPTALMAAATGSLNPYTVNAMLAARSSRATRGARLQAIRIANEIGANVELRARTRREFSAWMQNVNSTTPGQEHVVHE